MSMTPQLPYKSSWKLWQALAQLVLSILLMIQAFQLYSWSQRLHEYGKRDLEALKFIAKTGVLRSWDMPLYFDDMHIYRFGQDKELTVGEVMELLSHSPQIKIVHVPWAWTPRYNPTELAYPQYEEDFKLTQNQWHFLQLYCLSQLALSTSVDKTITAHWQSIVDGKPPFGLQVQSK